MKKLFGNVASVIGCLLAACALVGAAELKEARVTQVVSDVKLLPQQAAPRPAAVNDPVRDGTAVRTGTRSRSELTFTDQTITRLGANTIFSFKEGTRVMNLGEGAILFQVPKGAGGATIKTAAITAAITGTTGIGEFHPATDSNPHPVIKWFCLEGHIVLSLTDGSGQTVELQAGQMIATDGTYLPAPVFFDIAALVKSSLFFLGFDTQLASWDLIQSEIRKQLDLNLIAGLIDTNLFASLDPSKIIDAVDQARAAQESPTPSTPTPTPSTPTPTPSTPTPTPSTPTPTPGKFGALTVIASPDPYVISGDTEITTDPTITTNGQTDFGKIYRDPAQDGRLSEFLFGSTSAFDTASGFDSEIISSGEDAAVFKFTSLQLTGDPTISTTGGPVNLGLIAVNDITSGGPGGVLNFAGIRGLLLATQNGSINLGPEISFSGLHDITFYARGSGSMLSLASDVSTTNKIRLYGEGGIQLSSNLNTEELVAFTNGDFDFTAGSIDAGTVSIISGGDLSFSLGTPLSFKTKTFLLQAEGNIHINDSLEIIEDSLSPGADLSISLVAGSENILVEGDLSLTTNPGGVTTGANILVTSGGNTTIGGALTLLVDNSNGGQIETGGNISLVTGGNLSADSVDALVDNRDGGSIDSSLTLSLRVAAITISGDFFAGISNDAAGSMQSAALTVNATGNLTTDGFLELEIGNTGFNDSEFVDGGSIISDAIINVSAANVSAGDFVQAFIFNDGAGHIGRDALINGTISGDLSAESSVFFDIENAADVAGEEIVPGGTIDRNATVAVSVGGDITTPEVLEFAVLNNDFRFLTRGGTIAGNATVDVRAGSISSGDFFQPLINNTNGSIGGDATVTVEVKGPTDVGTQGYFRIINDTGIISGNALFTYSSGDVSIGDTLFAEIQNRDGGQIGEDAKLTFNANTLTVENTANFQILNGSSQNKFLLGGLINGQIGGDAVIDVNVANLNSGVLAGNIDNTAASIGGNAIIDFAVTGNIDTTVAAFGIFNSDTGFEGNPGSIGGDATINLSVDEDLDTNVLVGFIDNQNEGFIGGEAAINVTVGGNATITTDATFEILGSDNAESAAININGGNFDAGGTFRAFIDGSGTIAFNNVNVHADVLKVGALGANGVLNIGGGTLSADTQLKLYASGSNGQLNFIADVTLGGNSAKILAANSVTIFDNVVVTIGGTNPADVYTNNPNYSEGSGGNDSTTGRFAGAGANQPQPLPSAPPFDDSKKHRSAHPPANANAHHSPRSGPKVASPGGNNRDPNGSGRRLPGHVIKVHDSGQLLSLVEGTVGPDGKITIPNPNKTTSGRVDGTGRLNAERRPGNAANTSLYPTSRLP